MTRLGCCPPKRRNIEWSASQDDPNPRLLLPLPYKARTQPWGGGKFLPWEVVKGAVARRPAAGRGELWLSGGHLSNQGHWIPRLRPGVRWHKHQVSLGQPRLIAQSLCVFVFLLGACPVLRFI